MLKGMPFKPMTWKMTIYIPINLRWIFFRSNIYARKRKYTRKFALWNVEMLNIWQTTVWYATTSIGKILNKN